MGKPIIKQALRLCIKCGGEEFRPRRRCAFCNAAELRPAKEGEGAPTRVFFAISHNVWGLGATQETANAAMLKNWPRFLPTAGAKAQMWEAPRGAYVNMQGQIGYAEDAVPPVLLFEGVLS